MNWVAYKELKNISHSSVGWKSEIWMPASLGSGESPFKTHCKLSLLIPTYEGKRVGYSLTFLMGHWSHLRVSTFMTLIISQRSHIQVSSQWDLAFNIWMWGSHKSVCNTNLARYILNQKNTLIINIACQALNDLPTSYFLSSVKRTPFFMYTITESPSIMPSLCLNTCLHSCLIFLLKCVSYLSLPHS